MTTPVQSPVKPNQYSILPQKSIDKEFNTRFRSVIPLNTTLPTRKSVFTYLHYLDRCWRGGWSWQWPLVIAGPVDGGKTQLAYQLMASSLLSFPAPWRISYSDLAGDYRPERIQKILGWRKQGSSKQYQLGRVEKNMLCNVQPRDFNHFFMNIITAKFKYLRFHKFIASLLMLASSWWEIDFSTRPPDTGVQQLKR